MFSPEPAPANDHERCAMCEANVYLAEKDSDAEPELFLSAVDLVVPEEPDVWRLTSIFGEQKILYGRIKGMNLVDHRIVFEKAARQAEAGGAGG
jgi:predicted RNA-binding protein